MYKHIFFFLFSWNTSGISFGKTTQNKDIKTCSKDKTLFSGVKLISVGGRPTVVGRFLLSTPFGPYSSFPCENILPFLNSTLAVSKFYILVKRYGEEKTERLLRYSEDKTWVTLPTNMLDGRSDFQVLQKLPNKISIYPDMNSKTTRLNPGSGSDGNWRNLFGKVIDGKRTVWKGNTQQQQPWVQLDLVVETFVSKVIFETGNCAVCDGSDDVAQPVEVLLVPQRCAPVVATV